MSTVLNRLAEALRDGFLAVRSDEHPETFAQMQTALEEFEALPKRTQDLPDDELILALATPASTDDALRMLSTYYLAGELVTALRALRKEVDEMAARCGWAGHGARQQSDEVIAKYDSTR